jgi:hypothetical protein
MARRISAYRRWTTFGLTLGLTFIAGCADDRRARDFDQIDSEITALITDGSAASLATASLMSRRDTQAAQSARLIARAAALAPDRPDLIWVQWRECADTHCADEIEIRRRLKAVDPDNGLAWLADLEEAWGRQSPAEVTAVVAQMGAAPHMKIYWNSLVVMMTDALAGTGGPAHRSAIFSDSYTRMVYSVGVLAAVSIPPFQPVGKACRMDQFDEPGRRAACEAMIARLKDSDTVLTRSLGLSIQTSWWPEASTERNALLSERQQLYYLMMASGRERWLHKNRDAATRVDAARRLPSETDVMRAMLTAFHEPLERPPDWKDPLSAVK